jgi:Fe-S cluster biogenesis protein NfuA
MINQNELKPEEIMIRAQDTPNPNAIKFITNFALKTSGNATYTQEHLSKNQIVEQPLVLQLLNIPGVEQVYFFQNTVTVTHTEELPVEMIKDQVISSIKFNLTLHNPEFQGPDENQSRVKPDRSKFSKEQLEVEEILDRTIRPGLQSDGGDVEVVEFKDNEIKILYQGACGGCPSSMMGTLDAIQSILRTELKNDKIVVLPL